MIKIERFIVEQGPIAEKRRLRKMEDFLNEIGEENIINIVASLGEGAPEQRPTIYTIFYRA